MKASLVLAAMFAAALLMRAEARDVEAARLMDELMSGRGAVGTRFVLEDSEGRARSLDEFRGRWVVLYFGYTQCPDVCPTDLASMAGALRILGPAANAIQPIFITLDPERDTASLLREYAAAFHPRLIALRGNDADTTRIARAFKVFHEKRPLAHGGYLVDHTAFTFVLDPRGRYVAFLPPGTSAARIAQFLREVIETSK